ncbi:hypothetical protein ZHAS_00013525 [Anopheles sinensis]|uniref:Uncharacterized protein n=1 Tax=Anopheles sinensis TaxID=74873 RepID=A0A084W623_ANOSI|nr:hypothetical protein ZHAS_00013525 [Anopheles sinensis]
MTPNPGRIVPDPVAGKFRPTGSLLGHRPQVAGHQQQPFRHHQLRLIGDGLLRSELDQQLQTMLLILLQQQQTPALMSPPLRSVPPVTNRNGAGAIPRVRSPSGRGHSRRRRALQREEQLCLESTLRAQLLYDCYREWSVEPPATVGACCWTLQDALLRTFHQLLRAGNRTFPYPPTPQPPRRTARNRRNQYRTVQLPPGGTYRPTTATTTTTVTPGRSVAVSKPMKTATNRAPGNNNPLMPFLFVYVPLLAPVSITQQQQLSLRAGPLSAPPPPTLYDSSLATMFSRTHGIPPPLRVKPSGDESSPKFNRNLLRDVAQARVCRC